MEDYLKIHEWVEAEAFSWSYGENLYGRRWFKAEAYDLEHEVWNVYIVEKENGKIEAYAESIINDKFYECLDMHSFSSCIEWALQKVRTFPLKYPDSYWKELKRKEIESQSVVHFPENIQPITRKADKGIF